jgi:cytochrome c oxidase subunit II
MTPLAVLPQAVAVAPQSALEPGGPGAERIDWLWDLMLWSGTAVTLLVVVLLLIALFRRRHARELPPEADRPRDPRGEHANVETGGRGRADEGLPESERKGARWMIVGGVVFPTVVLTVLFLLNLQVLGALYPRGGEPAPLTVEVTGLQWWWEVRYLDSAPGRIVRSANELHLPVGRRVKLHLRSQDVIHSFWVPGLQGKMDMIPGRTNTFWVQADSAGVWRGQCAEFCGMQHAKMAFVVVAHSPEEFARWLEHERQPAAEPADSAGRAARATFLSSGCVLCHTVRGTTARATAGPDLTHVASRKTLAAGELPNTRGNLFGWIANPQALKPGTRMPAVPLTRDELHAITSYIGSLQ